MGREEQRAVFASPLMRSIAEAELPHCLGCFASCGFPARPAKASSGASGSYGLPAAPGGRQAAGAAHRAAPRDCHHRGGRHPHRQGEIECESESAGSYPHSSVGTIREDETRLPRCSAPRSEGCSTLQPIEEYETNNDSRLRRKFAFVQCEICTGPFVGEHSLRATAFVECKRREAVCCGD